MAVSLSLSLHDLRLSLKKLRNEDELIENIIIPLFQKCGFRLLKKPSHGQGEHGKDVIFQKEGDFGFPQYYAVQAKVQKIDKNNIRTIINQALSAHNVPFLNPATNSNSNIDYVFIITSDRITNDAEFEFYSDNSIEGKRQYFRIIDRERLLDLVEKIRRQPTTFVYLRQIEDILGKQNGKNASTYVGIKSYGPTFDDFEKGNIVETKEVEMILEQFRIGKRHLLLVGLSASGKTVIARNVGYKLINEKSVFFVDVDDISQEHLKDVVSEVREAQPSLIVVEDVHKNPVMASRLFEHIQNMDIFTLWTTRPSYKLDFARGQKSFLIELEKSKESSFSIEPERIVERIIDNNCTKRKIKLSRKTRNELVQKSGYDLWILQYLLYSVSDGIIDYDKLLQEIEQDFAEIDKEIPYASDVIVVLAFFYQYEIKIRKEFLFSITKLDYPSYYQLVREGYIFEDATRQSCSLRHSSIAKLFTEACEKYPYSHPTIRNRLQGKSAKESLFLEYIDFYPDEIFSIVQRIRYDNPFIESLMKNAKFRKILFAKLNDASESMDKVASLQSDITRITSELVRGDINNGIDVDSYAHRIDKEKDIDAIGGLLDGLPWQMDKVATKLIDESNKHVEEIGQGKNRSKDLRMGYCDWVVNWGRKDLVKERVESIFSRYEGGRDIEISALNFDHMGFCSKGAYSRRIRLCAKSIFCSASEKCKQIVDRINLETLSNKVDEQEDLYKIGHILSLINWVHPEISKKLFRRLNGSKLKEKISHTRDSQLRVFLLWQIFILGGLNATKPFIDVLDDITKKQIIESGWINTQERLLT